MTVSEPDLRVWMTVLGLKGGMDRVADLITQAVEERRELGIQVTRIKTRGIGGICRGSFVFIAALLRFWHAARRRHVDVLHLHMAAGGSAYRKLILARIAHRFGIPYIVHLHGSRFHDFWPSLDRRTGQAVDRLFRDSAKVIVLGRFWSRLVTDRVANMQNSVVILPNATRRVPPDRQRAPAGRVHISCIGLLGPRKGTPQLLEALGCLAERTDWDATIAGNGEVDASRMLAVGQGIADRVDMPGWLDEAAIDAVLRRTDILVLPSFAENLPMAILEGFAHGIAVVATPVGAIPEVIDHGRNGLMVPPGDVRALAKTICQLVDDPDLRLRLGAAARNDHLERYDLDVYVPRLAAIWREAARSSSS